MAEHHNITQEVLKTLKEQLTCGICLDSYKDPRLLQCFHVFCKDCLERLVVQDHQGLSLSCPNCRQSSLLPPGSVSGLQSAFHTNHLFEIQDALQKLKESHKTKCEKCEMQIATGFCRDCGQFICAKCTEIHQIWKELSSHEVVTIDQLQVEVTRFVPPKKKEMFCSKHPTKELDLYCESCEELICQHCIVRVHRDHQYDLVPDAFPKHKDAIVFSLQPVEQQLGVVNKALEHFDTKSHNIKGQREMVAENIHKAIKRLQDLLETRKMELIGQLDQITQQRLKSLAAQKDQIELVQTKLSSCLEFVNESLRTGSQKEILAMKKPVLKQIEEITADFKPDALMPQQYADMRFYGSSNLLQSCQHFGKVCTHPVSPERCFATGKGLEPVAVVGEQTTVVMHTIDVEGRECDEPLENLKCELVSEAKDFVVECKVEKKNSQYEITYQPIQRGKHQLCITVEGVHIKDSPFILVAIQKFGSPILTIEGFSLPHGVAVSDNGEIVVAASTIHGHECIAIFAQNGQKIRSFGTFGSAEGQFYSPTGIAIDSTGNILVADGANSHIQKFTAEGVFLKAVGRRGSGDLEFDYPVGIGINHKNNKVYVCDRWNHRVQILNEDLTFSSTITGIDKSCWDDGYFKFPWDVAFDSTGNIYVADSWNSCIQVFTQEGMFLRRFGSCLSDEGKMNFPSSVSIDSNDLVYVTSRNNHHVSIFTCLGKFVRSFGVKGEEPGELDMPSGIAVDTKGLVYVSDRNNNRVQIFCGVQIF